MSDTRRIINNTAWLSGAEFVNVVLSLISGILIVRYLGDTQYGKLGFVQAYVALFSIFTDFGWSGLLINEGSRNRENLPRYLDNLVAVKLLLNTACFAVMFIILGVSDKPLEIKIFTVFLASGMLVSSIVGPLTNVFRIYQEMQYEAGLRIVNIVASFLIVIATVFFHRSLMFLVIGNFIVTTLTALPTWLIVRKKYYAFRFGFDWTFIKTALKHALPLGISSVFVSIYYYLDTVILSFVKTDRAVGWYSADYRILLILLTFIGLYFAALFPELSRIIDHDLDRVRFLSRVTLRGMATLTIPLAIGAMFVGHDLLTTLFGTSFGPGSNALSILIWSVPIVAINSVYSNILLAKAKRTLQMTGVGLGALVNVILNILLIPPFSILGAALATFLSELFVFVFIFVKTSKHVLFIPFWDAVTRPFLAGACMGLVLWKLPTMHVAVEILIGASAYSICLFLIRGFTVAEIQTVVRILKKE